MEKISALVVDDEKPARQRLRDLLEKHPGVCVAGECASGAEAVGLIRERQPELLFLDIQMPVLNGFDVIRQVGAALMPVTVFVTAYDTYALSAFEASALDYLLKPYSDERFEQSLARALAYVRTQRREEMSRRLINVLSEADRGAQPGAAAALSSAPYLERLLVKVGGRIIFLPTEDVDWIEAAGVYVQLHTGGRKYLHRASLSDLEASLDPNRFIRIHRSSIVNILSVRELFPHSHGDYTAVLKDGTRLKLSRSYRPKLETRLRQSL
ncbi:MAG TPA: LytTR family DNA-binding domain-containing protein [Pyrinomonadaceae bacterium]|nr:LytTR family DNA-binding domain-containing protein [Pyrinomonadaceae bacterium]